MTPEQQRIAIAEACGWKRSDIVEYGPFPYWDNPKGEYMGGGSWFPIPDYLSDLNAMHEAEKVLDADGAQKYHDFLNTDPKAIAAQDYPATEFVYHATAAQRAEAFLRTLNLWK